MFSEIKMTGRGFGYYVFNDRHDNQCSLQKSSSVDTQCIWLGLESVIPKRLVFNQGWVDASSEIPSGIEFNTRMHLSQEQAGILARKLTHFAETGEI